MLKVKEIAAEIERLAPKALAEPWDNVGLMVGDLDQKAETVFLCLEATSETVAQAVRCGADLVVTHHPLIFSPLKRIVESDVEGGMIRTLIANHISLYSAHTNFDNADGGMNDILADKLGLETVRHFKEEECVDASGKPIDNIGRVGVLESPMEMGDYVNLVRHTLGCRTIKSVGDPEDTIQTVALCGGAGGGGIYNAYHAGADVYVTADLKHHEAQLAFELGLNLIDAGHFETEVIFCDFMREYLSVRFGDLKLVLADVQPYFV